MKQLIEIAFTDCQVTDQDLVTLRKVGHLERLSLGT